MVMFTAHLSITVKRLTIQAKNSFGCHFGGHTFALQNSFQNSFFLGGGRGGGGGRAGGGALIRNFEP